MTFRAKMMAAVLDVMTQCKHPKDLEDNDFDFVNAAGNYGASLDKAVSDFHHGEMAFVIKQTPVGDAEALSNTIKGRGMRGIDDSANQGPTGVIGPAPGAQVGATGATELDRGPEPQTIADTLDTTAPAPAEPKLPDVNDAPEVLSTKP